jgi:hypothetical protein
MSRNKGISAGAFMASFSSAGRDISCLNCKTRDARPDSIYCSEACRSAFLTFPDKPNPAKFAFVDRWDGQKFVEVQLTWNGSEYVEVL